MDPTWFLIWKGVWPRLYPCSGNSSMLFFGYHQWSTKPVEVMEFQLSDFKSWKMMLLKCCRQYASKSGKLSSASRTGNGQFSFQFLRTVPKNAQTTVQVGSFPTVPRLCSKSFKLSFSSTWTKNFQMYKLDLEKAEGPEIKLLLDHRESKGILAEHLFLLHWLC